MARGTMTTTLRNRLLLLLVLPVCVLAVAGSWWGYRSAETAAGQHDQRLLRLLPQLADSVMAPAIGKDMEPLMALSPSIDDFVRNRSGITGFAVADLDGHVLAGDPWISGRADHAGGGISQPGVRRHHLPRGRAARHDGGR
jgi:two-component system sensor histidine kinase TctE